MCLLDFSNSFCNILCKVKIKKNELFPDWKAHWLIIADKDADPYILNLSKSDGNDAPIYKAPHGAGEWKWRKVASSFLEFLEKLS